MSEFKKKSLVLLSGGLDSSAQCAFLDQENKAHGSIALTFHYGQRAALSEIQAAQEISKYYGFIHQVIELPFFQQFGKSALLRPEQKMPTPTRLELDLMQAAQESAAQVWVPNRNGIFINCASGFAEAHGIQEVLVGFNKEEAATFPDNTQEFINAINASLQYSTQNKVRVKSYTTQMSKIEMIKKLFTLEKKFPINSVWSCYEGGAHPCGVCESCQRFQRAKETVDFS